MGTKNNFDFLRLLFATLVMLTHCYALTGSGNSDSLSVLTNGQLAFSFIGLSGFFTISGYLIYKSLIRSKSLFENRVKRIFPGLTVVLVFCVVVGFFVSTKSNYFDSSSPYTYFLSQISLFHQFQTSIDGVFNNNIYPYEINSSLWTIAYEFFFYICLSALFFFRQRIVLIRCVLAVFLLLAFGYYTPLVAYKGFYISQNYTTLRFDFILYFGLFFVSGSLMAAFNIEEIKYKAHLVFAGVVISLVALWFNCFYIVKAISLPLIYIPFGLMCNKYLCQIRNRIGDISYGVYIYGFIIQQTFMNYHPFTFWQLGVLSIPIAYIFGALSWKFIESPFLKRSKVKLHEKNMLSKPEFHNR